VEFRECQRRIRSRCHQDGHLWFGTETGAARLHPDTREFLNFSSGTNGLAAGRVCDIEQTPDGTLWLRTCEGLSRYNGIGFEEIPGIPRLPQTTGVQSKGKPLAVDRQGRVWTAADDQGLWRIDGTNVVRLTRQDGLASLTHDALHVGSDGSVWFQESGLFHGITRFDGQHFESLGWHDLGSLSPRNPSMVSAIHQGPDGTLWFGHAGSGVTRHDPALRSITRASRPLDDRPVSPGMRTWP
jgi:streptogramin lyase